MSYQYDYEIEETLPDAIESLQEVNSNIISCGVNFFSGVSIFEYIDYMQSHSIDICITKYPTVGYLECLIKVLNFKSTILIWDVNSVFDKESRRFLSKKSYEITSENIFCGHTLYEFTKLKSASYIECFNQYYNIDIASLMFVGKLGFDDIVYCDALEFLDLQFYSLRKGRSVIMPAPLNESPYIISYLENKLENTNTNFNKHQQYELEF